jgi:tRNA pseudouridine38-40 synthase
MANYKLVLSYDGSDFCGWQRQVQRRTVQGVLEEALAKVAGEKVKVTGSGRTDAGVHAKGQTANFLANLRLDDKELQQALNALLPDDVKVLSLRQAAADFNARRSALSKIYEYRVFNSRIISPFLLRYVLYWPSPLDIRKMAEAAALFRREADFTAFSSNRELYPVRKVLRSEVKKRGKEIIYTVEANGFLRYMVRTIAGTLLEVGRGKIEPGRVEDIFRENRRSLAGPTAPAKGLCLVKVIY